MSFIGKTLAQAAAVVTGGILIGLVGNALSPVGLSLTRNYFPLDQPTNPPAPAPDPMTTPVPPVPDQPHPAPANDPARLSQTGAEALFGDPRRQADLVVFIDARNRTLFEQGHIPGAFLFDHYRPEEHLAEVLPVCQTAELAVVYCNGGSCEDSLLAAHTLKELGMPIERLRLYEGGFEAWRQAGLPVEIGPRLSGILESPSP